MANFYPRYKKYNNGCIAFLLAVEGLSRQLCVVPLKSKKQKEWEKALTKLFESEMGSCKTIFSDRDTSVKGTQFQERIKKRFGISWEFMKNREKCFRAERLIRYVS